MINISSLANILSINSNEILEIEEVTTEKEVRILVKLRPKVHSCPHCESNKVEFKEWKTRTIKHALFLNKETIFILKERRYRCLSCKKNVQRIKPFCFEKVKTYT